MKIRTRLALWYAGVLMVSLLIISGGTFQELIEQLQHDHSQKPIWHALKETSELLFPVGVPAVLLGLAGGWFLTRRALAPVAELTEAAERINEHTLGTALPRSQNGDELDRLAEVLNAMNRRLNDSFVRVRDFTLHASHELKTPLTIMCGETEIYLRDDMLTPAQREHATSRLEELRRLSKIVDGLTLLAKADAGLVPLALKSLQFDEIVHENLEDTSVLAASAGLDVKLLQCDPVKVAGNKHRLRQLLLNLSDNAVKYNQAEGGIQIALRRVDGFAEYTISNSGAGIPAEVLPRVFERFFRGDPSHNAEIEGSGLGLAISEWIVSSHKGTIKIESSKSSTIVTVRLPLAANNGEAT
ncbi:MAG TPA: ATP-binding protein [Verrucomicrobiae bacterium]|jgi:signal transduction histidine kinase|nr:ATP-binding protein [Verrucomicrobiae bacterium]